MGTERLRHQVRRLRPCAVSRRAWACPDAAALQYGANPVGLRDACWDIKVEAQQLAATAQQGSTKQRGEPKSRTPEGCLLNTGLGMRLFTD